MEYGYKLQNTICDSVITRNTLIRKREGNEKVAVYVVSLGSNSIKISLPNLYASLIFVSLKWITLEAVSLRFARERARKNYSRSRAENKVLLKGLRMRYQTEIWFTIPRYIPIEVTRLNTSISDGYFEARVSIGQPRFYSRMEQRSYKIAMKIKRATTMIIKFPFPMAWNNIRFYSIIARPTFSEMDTTPDEIS